MMGNVEEFELTLRGWVDAEGRIRPSTVDLLEEKAHHDVLNFALLNDETVLRILQDWQRKGVP